MRRLLFALLIPLGLNGWDSHADFIGRWGNYRKGAGVALFSPVQQDEGSLWFGQALGGWFREMWTGSIGGGYRSLWSDRVAWELTLSLTSQEPLLAKSTIKEGQVPSSLGTAGTCEPMATFLRAINLKGTTPLESSLEPMSLTRGLLSGSRPTSALILKGAME